MAPTTYPDGLAELLDNQLAVVSRGQLLAIGMTDNAMQYRIRSGGPWQVLLPGVYLGVTGTPNLIQKEMAALLFAGQRSVITGPAALLHYGINGAQNLDVIDVLVPAERQRGRPQEAAATAGGRGNRTGQPWARERASPGRGKGPALGEGKGPALGEGKGPALGEGKGPALGEGKVQPWARERVSPGRGRGSSPPRPAGGRRSG